MEEPNIQGLGAGIYSVADAARLTDISSRRIHRWFTGYCYRQHGLSRSMPAVLDGDFPPTTEDPRQLSFLDLMEIRFIDTFLKFGVNWNELRLAAKNATSLLSTNHPFSTCRFKTDGRRIFAEITDELHDTHLMQLRDQQHVFRAVVAPTLKGLEFGDEFIQRWWPLGSRRRVVVDPDRAFGKPICSISGVPALTIAHFAQHSSVKEAASWYEIQVREVRDALALVEYIAA